MTKVDIISGFLGAGKTTLISKLLKEALNGEQVVLIENEFGEIGIDGGFLKELLQEAAKKSGLCEKIFENFDERPKSLLYSIAMDSYMFALPGSGVGDSLEQQVYLATFNTIRHIADQGPCVISGRTSRRRRLAS